MAKTFTKGRTLTILLTISILANCAMGYYLHLALFDLKNAKEVNRLHIEEIKKLNKQIETRPTKFNLNTATPETSTQKPKRKISFNIPPIPHTSSRDPINTTIDMGAFRHVGEGPRAYTQTETKMPPINELPQIQPRDNGIHYIAPIGNPRNGNFVDVGSGDLYFMHH